MTNEIEKLPDGLRITRIFTAPRERVFEAWTNPEMVQTWWGCAQTTAVHSRIELRVDGAYTHTLDIEGCGQYEMQGHFTHYDPPAHLAWTTPGTNGMPTTHVDVRFEDLGQQTRVCLTLSGLENEEFKGIVTEGWKAGFAKLSQRIDSGMEQTT